MGPLDLSIMAPQSADELLDAAGDADELPFWAHVWDSGFGLARYLTRLAETRSGRPPLKVLEIGCGVGTVGCAAAALGWQVTMTDYQAAALGYAVENLARNGLMGSVAMADWRSFPVTGVFDLVVGSDVLYESTLHPALASLLGVFRSAGATIVVADPGRPNALSFAAAREKEGWTSNLELWDGRDGDIAIYVFSPPVHRTG